MIELFYLYEDSTEFLQITSKINKGPFFLHQMIEREEIFFLTIQTMVQLCLHRDSRMKFQQKCQQYLLCNKENIFVFISSFILKIIIK